MTDITPLFNGFLKQHEASTTKYSFSLENLDDFLKEAYRINSHITSLHADLRNIRQSYLSTAQPRKTLIRSAHNDRQSRPLSDREREEIDANAKKLLRELNTSIRRLADVEQARSEIESRVIQKKFARGLGALGAWAAGGTQTNKSPEHVVAEERVNSINTHRDSVLWLLRHRLQECVKTQQDMMEIRLMREMEKSRSVLAKSRRPDAPSLSTLGNMHGAGSPVESKGKANQALSPNEAQPPSLGGDLTEEQIQMFEKDNQDMLKFYESTLDQVRTTEKSLLEISELQTQLIDTLATQSAGIEQLVADSENTTENVGGGNRQLKQATQKASPAKYTFFATCGLCAFLIVWDLVI
ncbi:snare-complex protein syntaxin-18 N-terminus-domain-containing protein [Hypoxylon rubiginosum]|uniref:Snare-complex protein syntaxin-18 N-terminus-domain-containing protein n=1 Tax=Hypoxylon rubiginosum TaxID=110542 RepID=A0ACC0CXN2_9PEZI|nr:snare-complex protein syntaxin-18 N-terminus-domain-containing protein [Hypoxylon rubiginosum]